VQGGGNFLQERIGDSLIAHSLAGSMRPEPALQLEEKKKRDTGVSCLKGRVKCGSLSSEVFAEVGTGSEGGGELDRVRGKKKVPGERNGKPVSR